MKDESKSFGVIDITIEHTDGTEQKQVRNKILRGGRIIMAQSLANLFSGPFEFFISNMVFGSGGTVGGTPRVVDDTRAGLFGPTILTKGVIATNNPEIPTQSTFTSVITFDEAVGQVINEMALQFHSGDYYSMATFGDITKTSGTQITFNWKINFV